MKEVVLVGGVRTPVGNFGGALRDVTAQEMLKIVFMEVLKQTGINPELLDEVIAGCIIQSSDAPNIARVSALMAGVPETVPAYTVQRNCVSSIQAVSSAYQAIQTGDGELFLVGGTESMSNAPYVLRKARFGYRLRNGDIVDTLWEGLTDPIVDEIMGHTAENVAEKYGITREEQDEYAMLSHKKAFRATREGRFKDEIVVMQIPKKMAGRDVPPETFAEDECINIGLNKQMLSLYPTVFKENGTVTPGNACPISDGAAAMLVMSKDKADELGITPEFYVKSYGYAALSPAYMGEGPIFAVPKALERANLTIDDMDFVEINEAFAAQVIPCQRELKIPDEKFNVNGGAIALGHPVGATGAKLLVTMMHILKNRDGNLGLVSACVGGGMGGAIVIERK
ncbi:acetyl-CoA C-acyltransferase [candidate division KSB1 bacterium]|nr:acetyl-CoA C-acyltransferase [candidate division KSB1 bacterium]